VNLLSAAPLLKSLKSFSEVGSRILFFTALCFGATVVSAKQTEITVALDGTGQFKTVQEAIMFVPAGTGDNPVVIRIRPGVYKELIYIQHEKRFFRLIGEDAKTTVLTYDLHANLIGKDNKPIGTFRTPSTVIDADDFLAENITFENSAGPVGQALAIRVDGDRAVFHRCRFLGWQDTVFLNRGRQYFEDCYIAGHVDFIFGAATAFFERCHIHCLKTGYITAASTYDYHPYGFVFSNCKITGEAEAKTYLGRPWRDYSNAIYLNTEMSDVVRPEGWQNWNLPAREKTARYAEYNSTGAGANTKARVPWSKQLTKAQAKQITVKTVLSRSDGWDPLKIAGKGGKRRLVEQTRSEQVGKGGKRRLVEQTRSEQVGKGGKRQIAGLAQVTPSAPPLPFDPFNLGAKSLQLGSKCWESQRGRARGY
jgi:pectinesterase